jgi:iron complex outermembrane receptor protein
MLTAKVVLMTIVSAGLFAQVQPANDGVHPDASDSSHRKGTVVDPSGAPVAGAAVQIRNANGSTAGSLRTDANGAFTISGLPAGDYRLVVAGPGFETKEVPVTIGGAETAAPLRIALTVSGTRSTVLVTATRSEEEADKQPASSSVVTIEDIQNRNVQTLDQGLDMVPGLYNLRDKGPADTMPATFLRGFYGANRTLVLLDGQPINDPFYGGVSWTSLPTDEVQSVEVVRGPFSSLYGGNALGGVINVLTRQASRRELDLTGEYGSYNTKRYSARFTDRFWNKLGISLGYQRLQFGGYNSVPVETYATEGTGPAVTGAIPTVDTYGNQAFLIGDGGRNWAGQRSYYVKGGFTPTDATVLNVQYLRQDYAYGYDMYHSFLKTASGNTVDTGTFLANYNGVPEAISVLPSSFLQDDGDRHSHFFSASLFHKFSSAQFLRLDGGYYDTPNSNYRMPDYFSTASGGTGTYTNNPAHSFHGNVQYNRNLHRHTIVVGSEARQDMASNPIYALSNWTSPNTIDGQDQSAIGRSYNLAAYVQDEINVTERLHVVAGGRYEYWQTYDGETNGYTASLPLTMYPNRSANSVTGKLGATYGLPGDWTIRASVGTAFRNPDVEELYGSFTYWGMTFAASPHLSPERDRSFEFGVHKRFGAHADFDADFFQNNISGLIYREADLSVDPSGNYLVNVNAAEGRTRGFETALRTRLLSWLTFRSTYTYTNAIITDNPAEPYSVGMHVPNIPDNMFGGQLIAQRGKWLGSLTGRYVSATFSSDSNTDIVKGVPGANDPYSLLNANVVYQFNSHVQVLATGENLLDRQYYLFYLAPGRDVHVGFRLKL